MSFLAKNNNYSFSILPCEDTKKLIVEIFLDSQKTKYIDFELVFNPWTEIIESFFDQERYKFFDFESFKKAEVFSEILQEAKKTFHETFRDLTNGVTFNFDGERISIFFDILIKKENLGEVDYLVKNYEGFIDLYKLSGEGEKNKKKALKRLGSDKDFARTIYDKLIDFRKEAYFKKVEIDPDQLDLEKIYPISAFMQDCKLCKVKKSHINLIEG